MVIPGGKTFLLSQIRLDGPCKSPVTVEVTLVDDQAELLRHPSVFYRVNNLTVNGSGQMDGNGDIWWTCFNQKVGSSADIFHLLLFLYSFATN